MGFSTLTYTIHRVLQVELARSEPAAAEGVVLTQISDAISAHAADVLHVDLSSETLAALTSQVKARHERGQTIHEAAVASLSSWVQLYDQVVQTLRTCAQLSKTNAFCAPMNASEQGQTDSTARTMITSLLQVATIDLPH